MKNAAANLARGGAIAAFSLLLPPFLVRHMAPAAYAVWVLVLQVAAYIGYFDFGLQTAIGRYIAFSEERKDAALRDSIFSTAISGLQIAAGLSCVLLLLLAFGVPYFFPAVPPSFVQTMRWTMLIVGFSFAAGLPASACNGVFVGLQRNEISAATTGGAKLLSAAGIVLAVLAGRSLIVMALIVAAANMLAYVAQYAAMRKIAPQLQFRRSAVQRSAARELFDYCFALTVMSFAMLLITGFDLLLVGRFQFAAVIPYSIAATFVPIIAGSLFAVLNAMMPHAARLHAQGAVADLGRLVISSTRISVLLLVVTGLPAIIYAGPILKLWIGQAFVSQGRLILIVLLIANIVRLVGAAYAIVLIAAGQQNLIKVSPLAEGVSNLAASIVLGAAMGAIGVALGTLIGAVVGLAAHLFYSMPRTKPEIGFARRDYLWSGVLLPVVCTSPLIAAGAWSIWASRITPGYFLLALTISIAAGAALLYRSGTLAEGIDNLRARWS
jgi:O-antigen/teichoic acid export membrane protein